MQQSEPTGNAVEPLSVPDELKPHLDEIATRLYTKHAAVMVGAGFSRNASTHIPTNAGFPSWRELGDAFVAKLGYDKSAPEDRYLNIPTLAHEVEAVFGRQVLDNLLKESIPDTYFEPSPIHAALLELPWTDVFTTNYDTLLERASRTSARQRYDHVTKQQDLVHAERPRIVKLHGSFPSNKPFVITDEDYRLYPTTFAPFLNTVHQSLLENTLCLVGFSGTDPNFLQWIGWLHDHLGHEHTPRIYLIAHSRFAPSQVHLLRRRNIIVLDMSSFDGVSADGPNTAIKSFLDFLEARRGKFEIFNWPNTPSPATASGSRPPKTVASVVSEWTRQRECYPGWVIVPDVQRARLWRDTESHLRNWWNLADVKLPEPTSVLALEFAFEVIWRSEKCLFPMDARQIAFFEDVIDSQVGRFNFNGQTTSLPLSPGDDSTPYSFHSRNKFHHVLLAVLRYYREEGFLSEWKCAHDRIKSTILTLSPEHKAQFFYETALQALYRLDLPRLRDSLQIWPTDGSLPYWEAKRAGILAEIGHTAEAKRILRATLADLRSQSNLKPIAGDCTTVSQESVSMLLLQYMPLYVDEFPDYYKMPRELEHRWHRLQEYKCDLRLEFKLLKLALDKPYTPASGTSTSPAFDIGMETRSVQYANRDHDLDNAYSFLRLCEDVALPLKWISPAVQNALSKIVTTSPYWAIVNLIRLGENRPKSIDLIFDRLSLARMTSKHVDSLIDTFLQALRQADPEIPLASNPLNSSFAHRLARALPEVLSRLCSKCSPSKRATLLEFVIQVYNSHNRLGYTRMNFLTQRLLTSMSHIERVNAILPLLEVQVKLDATETDKHEFPNPISYLHIDHVPLDNPPQIPRHIVDQLLVHGAGIDSNARKCALQTLAKLFEFKLLDSQHSCKFGTVLWCQVDKHGWPSGTSLSDDIIVLVPRHAGVQLEELFVQRLRQTPFPCIEANRQTIGGAKRTVFGDIQWACYNLPLQQNVVQEIMDLCLGWWSDLRTAAIPMGTDNAFPFGNSDYTSTVLEFTDAVAAIIQCAVRLRHPLNAKADVHRLIADLNRLAYPVLQLEIAAFHWFPGRKGQVVDDIKQGLASTDPEKVGHSIDAVRTLLERSTAFGCDLNDSESADLLTYVAQKLYWCRRPGLPGACDVIRSVVNQSPGLFNHELERMILGGLRHINCETATESPSVDYPVSELDKMGFANQLIIRKWGARLAFALFEYYGSNECSIPAVISEWEAVCSSEAEFAEIRNEWKVRLPAA